MKKINFSKIATALVFAVALNVSFSIQAQNYVEADLQDTAWIHAKQSNTHAGYGHYVVSGLLKMECPHCAEARDKMRELEEPAWKRIERTSNWNDYYEFLLKYPMGYYCSSVLERIDSLIALDSTASGIYLKRGKGLLVLANASSDHRQIIRFKIADNHNKVVWEKSLQVGEIMEVPLTVGDYYIQVGDQTNKLCIKQLVYPQIWAQWNNIPVLQYNVGDDYTRFDLGLIENVFDRVYNITKDQRTAFEQKIEDRAVSHYKVKQYEYDILKLFYLFDVLESE